MYKLIFTFIFFIANALNASVNYDDIYEPQTKKMSVLGKKLLMHKQRGNS